MSSRSNLALFGIDDIAVHVLDDNRRADNVLIQGVGGFRLAAFKRHDIAEHLRDLAYVGHGLSTKIGNIHTQKAVQLFVGLNGLFNAGILNQLIGKFGRIHRIKRILIFQLRG